MLGANLAGAAAISRSISSSWSLACLAAWDYESLRNTNVKFKTFDYD
jgi:hypothetical protein